jgi:hypothetical protein
MSEDIKLVEATQDEQEACVAHCVMLDGRAAELTDLFLRGREEVLLGTDDIDGEGVILFKTSEGDYGLVFFPKVERITRNVKAEDTKDEKAVD